MFTVKFKKETETPLKPLYEQIVRDYLGNMPVYRDTLVRGGTLFVVTTWQSTIVYKVVWKFPSFLKMQCMSHKVAARRAFTKLDQVELHRTISTPHTSTYLRTYILTHISIISQTNLARKWLQ